jgi:ABC-type amino acid transport system permease subunit
VNAELVTELVAPLQRATTRARIMSAVGPATALAGVIWALVQPYRITLLHPRGQGFWWLVVEAPLLVIAVGLFFHFVVVPGLLEDLEEEEHATGQ